MQLAKNKCINCAAVQWLFSSFAEKDMNTIQDLCLFVQHTALSEKCRQAAKTPSEK